jgi:ribonuclease P protein component
MALTQFSFGRESRINSSYFETFKKSINKKFSSTFFIIYFDKNNEIFTKLGITVNKKSANSVFRSKIKRIIKENFRLSSARRLGLNINFVYKKSLGKVDKNFLKLNRINIHSDINFCLKKLQNLESR